MDITETWRSSLSEAQQTLNRFLADPALMQKCAEFSQVLIDTFRRSGTAFACGNGGSHCDAMHFAEELTGRYRRDRRPLGALALGDSAHVTCTSNDYGFEHIFERQLRGLGRTGDVLVCLSTSGNSVNVIRAVKAARELGLKTIGLLGRSGGELRSLVDVGIIVPAETSDRIQEIHIKVIHTVIETVERELFPENYRP
jgi:D-sedoheptulose 7-phosphate isomerase